MCVCGVMVGASGRWPVLLTVGAAGLSLLLVAALWEWIALARLRPEITRTCDDKLSLGAENRIRIDVRNSAHTRLVGAVRDEYPESTTAPGNVMSLDIPPRSEAHLTYLVTPSNRGVFEFGDIYLRLRGPLGLTTRQIRYPAKRTVKVYPNLIDVRRYEIGMRRNRTMQPGQRTAHSRGRGTEFESLRDYTLDDEFRSIDWKATARRGKPISRQYQQERSQSVLILLDCGRVMGAVVDGLSRLDHSINAAMMLAQVSALAGDKVGLMAFDRDAARFLPPKPGKSQFLRLLSVAYDLKEGEDDSDYAKAISYLSARWTRRSLVVVFTELTDLESSMPLITQLSSLAKRHLCVCVMLSDPSVAAAAAGPVTSAEDVFESAAARQLLQVRKLAAARMSAAGVLVIDAQPGDLTSSVVNAYSNVKATARL